MGRDLYSTTTLEIVDGQIKFKTEVTTFWETFETYGLSGKSPLRINRA